MKNNQTPIEKIAAKKPDCVRADMFEFCLIIGDLWAYQIILLLKKYFQECRAYTLFEFAIFKYERGARSCVIHFLEILTVPGGCRMVTKQGILFVTYASNHLAKHGSVNDMTDISS